MTMYLYHQPRFNSAFSRNNSSRIKDGAYAINLDGKKVKKYIASHYLLTKMQLCTLIFFGNEYIA